MKLGIAGLLLCMSMQTYALYQVAHVPHVNASSPVPAVHQRLCSKAPKSEKPKECILPGSNYSLAPRIVEAITSGDAPLVKKYFEHPGILIDFVKRRKLLAQAFTLLANTPVQKTQEVTSYILDELRPEELGSVPLLECILDQAAHHGNEQVVSYLSMHGYQLLCTTKLIEALHNNDHQRAKILLTGVNIHNNLVQLPFSVFLQVAIKEARVWGVKELVKRGVQVLQENNGQSALKLAFELYDNEIVGSEAKECRRKIIMELCKELSTDELGVAITQLTRLYPKYDTTILDDIKRAKTYPKQISMDENLASLEKSGAETIKWFEDRCKDIGWLTAIYVLFCPRLRQQPPN
jgi:hypothetical protein